MMTLLSAAVLFAMACPLAYLYLLVVAAVRPARPAGGGPALHRFAVAIPAHDEESVIGTTVAALLRSDYPAHLFDVHVAADYCTDRTADVARRAGALVHARDTGQRGSKGAALVWLFERILEPTVGSHLSAPYDAVVVFDADTQVTPDFLRRMDARLAAGEQVVQGQHRIANPEDGWFPALTSAMFVVDNRFQNLGRSNLGWSAKNMGDSICFRSDLLRTMGWGRGLAEDYAFRHRLLLAGVRIAYEPAAVGYGEAPLTWRTARAQRARWLRGTRDASRRYAPEMLRAALRQRDPALLDGALQAYLPSYSTLTLLVTTIWGAQLAAAWLRPELSAAPVLLALWGLVVAALVVYPLLGLALERAPARAYLAILSGPVFVVWRTWVAVTARLTGRVEWVRTPRRAS